LHFAWSEALADRDDLPGAVVELRAAVALKADAAEAFYRLGVALDKLKKYEEAVVAFEKAIGVSPREVNYYQSLGFTYDTMGQHEKAIGCFKRAVELERRK
jgi:tetratricopeptide (TPR) repeat protein